MEPVVPHLQVVVWWTQICSSCCSVALLYLALSATYRLKMADVMMDQHRRYDQLLESRDRMCQAGGSDVRVVKAYLLRYWNLHLDRWIHWRQGLVSSETYEQWVSARLRDWDVNEPISEGVSYKDGWAMVQDTFSHTGFHDFMRDVHNHAIPIESTLKKWGPNHLRRLFATLLQL